MGSRPLNWIDSAACCGTAQGHLILLQSLLTTLKLMPFSPLRLPAPGSNPHHSAQWVLSWAPARVSQPQVPGIQFVLQSASFSMALWSSNTCRAPPSPPSPTTWLLSLLSASQSAPCASAQPLPSSCSLKRMQAADISKNTELGVLARPPWLLPPFRLSLSDLVPSALCQTVVRGAQERRRVRVLP